MIHFLNPYNILLFKRNKMSVSFAVYGLLVPVHFHFGFFAQTTSKDFVS